MTHFTMTNTEGFGEADLAEMNAEFMASTKHLDRTGLDYAAECKEVAESILSKWAAKDAMSDFNYVGSPHHY